MAVDSQQATTEIHCVTNVSPGDTEGLIVNLHPSFPILKDQIHKDRVFPWLKHVQEVGDAQRWQFSDIAGAKTLEELRELASRLQPTSDAWSVLKKSWSLERNGKSDIAVTELRRYATRGYSGPYVLPNVLFHFCGVMLHPALLPLFENAALTTSAIKEEAPIEFDRFKEFFLTTWRTEHDTRYFEVFKEYFRSFHELSQTLLHCQYALPLAENAAASSTAFSETRMLYGNLYESLTSNLVVLACLNNVRRSRPFEQFERFTLKKYMSLHKARRGDAFSDCESYSKLTEFLDSTLRNASHHGAMHIERRSARIVFRSGGTGARQQITYAEYLYRCNQVFLRLCALLMLELALAAANET